MFAPISCLLLMNQALMSQLRREEKSFRLPQDRVSAPRFTQDSATVACVCGRAAIGEAGNARNATRQMGRPRPHHGEFRWKNMPLALLHCHCRIVGARRFRPDVAQLPQRRARGRAGADRARSYAAYRSARAHVRAGVYRAAGADRRPVVPHNWSSSTSP